MTSSDIVLNRTTSYLAWTNHKERNELRDDIDNRNKIDKSRYDMASCELLSSKRASEERRWIRRSQLASEAACSEASKQATQRRTRGSNAGPVPLSPEGTSGSTTEHYCHMPHASSPRSCRHFGLAITPHRRGNSTPNFFAASSCASLYCSGVSFIFCGRGLISTRSKPKSKSGGSAGMQRRSKW